MSCLFIHVQIHDNESYLTLTSHSIVEQVQESMWTRTNWEVITNS
jgi:hypothetical protein